MLFPNKNNVKKLSLKSVTLKAAVVDAETNLSEKNGGLDS